MKRSKVVLVTGGSGFIGSSFIRYGLKSIDWCHSLINLDLLTYAAHPRNLNEVEQDPRYHFVKGDICDQELVEKLCTDKQVDMIVHFAAETHVDRSIVNPYPFFHTNVGGTLALLEVVRKHPHIHFHHISTDEVYGSLSHEGTFSEQSPYCPNSPYAASKAASDHFVHAYAHTYGLSVTLSHCTNNFGPCQHVEKFIPRMLASCVHQKPLPIYGTGENIRDWLFVDDHSQAVWTILEKGKKGEVYDIGGECEKRNIDVIHDLIDMLDQPSLRELIMFIPDRPGHDLRYAINCRKIKEELGWEPRYDFRAGMRDTIAWYLNHPERLVTT